MSAGSAQPPRGWAVLAFPPEARQRNEASALAAQPREEPAPEVVARRVLTALPMMVIGLGVAEAEAGLSKAPGLVLV
jgi:hypothetical protein